MKNIATVGDFRNSETIFKLLDLASEIKSNPSRFQNALSFKTLLLIFEKPSLRTRLSFEVAIRQMGGSSIYYNTADGPVGKKENIHDTAKCYSRYVDIVTARCKSRDTLNQLIEHSEVPVINALDDFGHPCQILADWFTIKEYKFPHQEKHFKELTMVYLGDLKNNVTYDIMRMCAMMGMKLRISGPEQVEEEQVWKFCNEWSVKTGAEIKYIENAEEAVANVDVIYTDSWMSYGIAETEKEIRMRKFEPFRVTSKLLKLAKQDCIFLNCLPAMRGMEETSDVIDGNHSVVFDEAENRLHTEKAVLLYCLYGNNVFTMFLGEGNIQLQNNMQFNVKQRSRGKILLALGGNAIWKAEDSFEKQLEQVKNTCAQIGKLMCQGYSLAIVHGNGPQVGELYLQNLLCQESVASKSELSFSIPTIPLSQCVAFTQAQIGSLFDICLNNEVNSFKQDKYKLSTVLTHVEVSMEDESFKNPSKPIGPFLSQKDTELLQKMNPHLKFKTVEDAKDASKPFRIVVPSPKPTKIVEIATIKHLLQNDINVICGGGGGIAIQKGTSAFKQHEFVDCVVDKDFTSEWLANALNVEIMIVASSEKGVYKNYRKENQELLKNLTVNQVKQYLKEGIWAEGSLIPKMQAIVNFLESNKDKKVIVCHLNQISQVMKNGNDGSQEWTCVTYE